MIPGCPADVAVLFVCPPPTRGADLLPDSGIMRWGTPGRWPDRKNALGCSRVIPGVMLFMWEIENGEQPPSRCTGVKIWHCDGDSRWEGLVKQAELIMRLTELN